MSTEASYALQQNLYALYRKYYHTGCVVLLGQNDFEKGTLRLTKPGLYVLREDIVFNPDSSFLESDPYYSSNNAYSMGFFAALTVECDGVILDLQGNTIRQSYEHYARQRFFSVIELANAPFIVGQGPGSVQTASTFEFKAATNCLIVNGTIGLSSHSGVHGNNNANIMLQNVCVQDFESAGVQLNGVDTAFMDSVVVRGTECAPLASPMFTLLRHQIELQKLKEESGNAPAEESGDAPTEESAVSAELNILAADGGTCATINLDVLVDATDRLVCALLKPFIQQDVDAAATSTPKTVQLALKEISMALLDLTDSTVLQPCEPSTVSGDADGPRYNVERFVQQKDSDGFASPDGSAIYGFLFNSSGIAIGELTEGCPANGGSCCPVKPASSSTCCQPSKNVTVHNCTISDMRLNAKESVAVRVAGKILRDVTAAIVDVSALDLSAPKASVLDLAQVYVNSELTTQTTWCAAVQRMLACPGEGDPYSPIIEECGDVAFVYNVDIMAHVSKGVFGIRAEETKGLSVENTCIRRLTNTSQTTCPRTAYQLPVDATVVSIITNPTDQTEDLAHGGANMRGLFVGNSEGVLLTKVSLDTLSTLQGCCRGAEFDVTNTACVHALTATKLQGILTTTVHVHSSCRKMTMREVTNSDAKATTSPPFRKLLEDVQSACIAAQSNPTDDDLQKEKDEMLCRLLRLPSADTQLLAIETPAVLGDNKLC